MPGSNTRFAGYPSAVVYENSNGTKAIQHLLWGDWLTLKRGRAGDYYEVHARGCDGWMHKDSFQKDRLLEVVFVDVGQGDGCLVVTPDDKHLVIDAGDHDNMCRFLRWRYGGFDNAFEFEAAVMSHPDKDHYGGFSKLFDHQNVEFKTVYHNGIMEQRGTESLGKTKKRNRRKYVVGTVKSKAELKAFLAKKSNWKHPSGKQYDKKYPTLLAKGLDNGVIGDFKMLSVKDAYLPGYGPSDRITIEVLGPVTEDIGNGVEGLRWFGSKGKTKNGHSVVLRLVYGEVSVLLGGDLNIPSEELLLSHHTGLACPPSDSDEEEILIEAARTVFQVDIAKSCHHGSPDFSKLFLSALNPIATVISSGDDEPHSHPRADTLGAIGAHGRGSRPLIFSTELARSTKETVKHPNVLRQQLVQMQRDIKTAPTDTPAQQRKKARLEKAYEKFVNDVIDRSVAVFGAINLRTDGEKAVVAQKLERPRGQDRKWDIYKIEPQGRGGLRFVSKHDAH